jgi:hypothetical protein
MCSALLQYADELEARARAEAAAMAAWEAEQARAAAERAAWEAEQARLAEAEAQRAAQAEAAQRAAADAAAAEAAAEAARLEDAARLEAAKPIKVCEACACVRLRGRARACERHWRAHSAAGDADDMHRHVQAANCAACLQPRVRLRPLLLARARPRRLTWACRCAQNPGRTWCWWAATRCWGRGT